MMFSPARTVLPPANTCDKRASLTRGGNLARPQANSRSGHSLFPKTPHNIGAHLTDPDEAAAASSAASGRARRQIGSGVSAESRPSLFSEVNYLTHSSFSNVPSRTRKHRRTSFHEDGKAFHDGAR